MTEHTFVCINPVAFDCPPWQGMPEGSQYHFIRNSEYEVLDYTDKGARAYRVQGYFRYYSGIFHDLAQPSRIIRWIPEEAVEGAIRK